MNRKKVYLCDAVKAEMIGASALLEAETLLAQESDDFLRGFLRGYDHCLKLVESYETIKISDDSKKV
jgi:hypothetical protein